MKILINVSRPYKNSFTFIWEKSETQHASLLGKLILVVDRHLILEL